ncbi:MAG: hypothetical protein ABH875_01780 [Candidatus Omnitrophota bacterium]
MTFFVIGIDHKTASLKTREAAYRSRKEIGLYWQSLNPGRTALLTTCNRMEVWGVASDLGEAAALCGIFKCRFREHFKDAYIKHEREDVVRHGLRLACGLESQLRGERQIMQQLDAWIATADFADPLKELWRAIIGSARKIREEAGLNEEEINIAGLLFDDLKQKIAVGKDTEIIVIGTGKIAQLIARGRPKDGRLIFVARKKRSKAKRLARISGGTALLPEEIERHLIAADALVCATSSPHYVITPAYFKEIARFRTKPLYIYDLAVPRDVAPGVGKVSFAIIKDLDELTLGSSTNKDLLRRLNLAEELVDRTVIASKVPEGYEAKQSQAFEIASSSYVNVSSSQ